MLELAVRKENTLDDVWDSGYDDRLTWDSARLHECYLFTARLMNEYLVSGDWEFAAKLWPQFHALRCIHSLSPEQLALKRMQYKIYGTFDW